MKECPNCLSELEPMDEGSGHRCPVCQFSVRPCPDCSGDMIKGVEAPEGVGIEADGLPLSQCVVYWVCQSEACGLKIETEL